MSTYLVAVVISDFVCQKGVAKPSNTRNIDISVCAKPNAQDQLELALESSIKMSEFFEDYYGIAYPLTKLDHAGVPQFKYGGKIRHFISKDFYNFN